MIFSNARIGKVSGDGEPSGDGGGGVVGGVDFFGLGGSGFEEVVGDGGDGRENLGRIWW